MVYNQDLALQVADGLCLTFYTLLVIFEAFVIGRYLIPLKITSPYILAFFIFLTILLISSMLEIIFRLAFEDPGFLIGMDKPMTVGEIC